MRFSDRIHVLMGLYQLRPVEVCDRIGMHQSQFTRILSGPYDPLPETRRRIIEAICAEDFAPRQTARTSQTATR